MKNKTKIVRNFAVFCALSKLRDLKDEVAHKQKKNKVLNDRIEYILSIVFKEQANYDILQHYYLEALQSKENIYFSFAYFCDKKHAIRIDGSGNILLYFYQDNIRIGVPWNYPHLITCIGTTDKYANLYSFVHEFKKMSTLDYFLKYFLHKDKSTHVINSICEGYLVDGFLKIIIDDHITFQWEDSSHNCQEKYIADSWGWTKKDIICDLTNIPLLKFGKKYAGYWGR